MSRPRQKGLFTMACNAGSAVPEGKSTRLQYMCVDGVSSGGGGGGGLQRAIRSAPLALYAATLHTTTSTRPHRGVHTWGAEPKAIALRGAYMRLSSGTVVTMRALLE